MKQLWQEIKDPSVSKPSNLLSRHSIRWRLVFSFAIFVAILLIILWLFQIVFLDSFYKSFKTNSIKSVANSIAENIDNDDFYENIDRLTRQEDLCVHLVDKAGVTLYSSDTKSSCILHMLAPEQIIALFSQAENGDHTVLQNYQLHELTPSLARKDTDTQEQMIYGILIEQDTETPVMVLVDATISPVTTTIEALKAQLIIITIILVGISVVLVIFLSSTISRPLVRINESAKELAKGNYSTHFEEGKYLEVRELANTLNIASEELSTVERLRQEFIANVSHDLRTPLTMISGYAEIMRDLPGENTPENVQIIIDESKRLTDLVNDLLDLSRLQSGTAGIVMEPVHLSSLLRMIMERYTKLVDHDGYTISLDIQEEVWILGDELRMTQVLYNLVNNAVNYAGNDKIVIIRLTTTEDIARVDVIDHGEGIDKENLPYIWDRYYKVDKSHKRPTKGAGIGLSIVKSVLEMHHARYGVESTPGDGSDFWFEIRRYFPEEKEE